MPRPSPPMPSCTIAVMSRYYLIWLGFKSVFERAATRGIVMHPYHRTTSDLLRADRHPDVVILDLETERDAIGTIRQIRGSAPNSKIVALSGVGDQQPLHEAVAYGVDGVILTIQPPAVVLATIEAMYPPLPNRAQAEHSGVAWVDLRHASKQPVDSTVLPVWSDALTERERGIVRLVGQGLSNKEIAHRLCIADSTVRHHLTNIFDKTGVPNRQKLLIHTHRVPSIPTGTEQVRPSLADHVYSE